MKEPKILLVDDEPDLVEMLKFRLAANNYEVITANNGEACLEKAKAEAPDVNPSGFNYACYGRL